MHKQCCQLKIVFLLSSYLILLTNMGSALAQATVTIGSGNVLGEISIIQPNRFNISDQVLLSAAVFLDGEPANEFTVSLGDAIRSVDSCPVDPPSGLRICNMMVTLGPTLPANGLPNTVVYRDLYAQSIPDRPVFATLTHVPSNTTASVDSRYFLDGRRISREGNGQREIDPMVTQISPTGMQALGNTHAQPLPFPDVEQFNATMQNRIVAPDNFRSREFEDEICFPISTFDAFKETSAYDIVTGLSNISFAAWQAADTLCETGTAAACLVREGLCVNERVEPDHFEVCVDGANATWKTQEVERLEQVVIALGSQSDTLDTNVFFDQLNANFDVDLSQDVFIRYRREDEIEEEGEPGLLDQCLPRPSIEVSAQEILDEPILAEWASCANVPIEVETVCSNCDPDFPEDLSGSVVSRPNTVLMSADSSNPEQVTFSEVRDAGMLFKDIEITIPEETTCADNILGYPSEVTPLLEGFLQSMRENIQETWENPIADTNYNDIVDDLLVPIEVGELGPATQVSPDLVILDARIEPIVGLSTIHSTNASATGDNPLPAPANILVNGNPNAAFIPLGFPFSTNGLAPGSVPYDVSFGFTTAYLNQIIGVQHIRALTFNVRPTNAELNVSGPGINPNDTAQLNGETLGQYFLPFEQIGLNDTATIRVTATQEPFTWMANDFGPPGTIVPVNYTIPSLKLELLSQGQVYAELVLHKINEEIDINFSEKIEDPFLSILDKNGSAWRSIILSSLFTNPDNGDNCGFDAFNSPGQTTCGQLMAEHLLELARPQLDARAYGMLSEIAAPQYFDQEKTSFAPSILVNLPQQQRIQNESYITIFGTLQDAQLSDQDNDGVFDAIDNCPSISNSNQLNSDSDDNGNACDNDDDNDGDNDGNDNCPFDSNSAQLDTDGDGTGDVCDDDIDGDFVDNVADNCPLVPNTNQANSTDDDQGDACDNDRDNDGIDDDADNCPEDANPGQFDQDGDRQGDACDADPDGDGIDQSIDNCPFIANSDQLDANKDDEGDACDADDDGDSVIDEEDNCPFDFNFNQQNLDRDAQGDACDLDDDNDGINDVQDNCPRTPNQNQLDTDEDGIGNACDTRNVPIAPILDLLLSNKWMAPYFIFAPPS